jgi:hypothetical protein
LAAQGDRLVYSNGILLLALAAGALLLAFDASLTTLIQLYVVGVFLALTLGQAGMVRHWTTVLSRNPPSAQRSAARRARAIAVLACAVTGLVLVVVLLSKLTAGAWVVVVLIPTLAWAMRKVRDHYDTVADVMAPQDTVQTDARQSVSALILVSRIHKPTLRAVAYARASRPSTLQAVTVAVDADEAAELQRDWDERQLNVPLEVLDSPYREINSPVMKHVAALRHRDPDGLLMVYVPEYVVDRWWEQLLHNQSAARLKRRLMSLPNVVVVSVPWQLAATLDESIGAQAGATSTVGDRGGSDGQP